MKRAWSALAASLGAVVTCCATTSASPSPPAPLPVAATPAATATATARSIDPDAFEGLRKVYLGAVLVERGAPGKVGGSTGAQVTLSGDLGAGALELARRGLRLVRTGATVDITVHGYPARDEAPRARDTAASFVIDFDTDAVAKVRAQLIRDYGETPAMRDLTRFVAAFVDRKDLSRGYDPASVVARRKQGDCTEHAVLLAALGRSFGYPARVVHGIVFFEEHGQLAGAMHAWSEWHDGKRWTFADAAIGEEHDPLYLPLQTVEDETPAFGRMFTATGLGVRKATLTPR